MIRSEQRAAYRAALDARRLGLSALDGVAPELLAAGLSRGLAHDTMTALTERSRYRDRMVVRLARATRLAPLLPDDLGPAALLALNHPARVEATLVPRCGIAALAGSVLSMLDPADQALMSDRLGLDVRSAAMADRQDAADLGMGQGGAAQALSAEALVEAIEAEGRHCVGGWLFGAPPSVAQRVSLLVPGMIPFIGQADPACSTLTDRIAARILQTLS